MVGGETLPSGRRGRLGRVEFHPAAVWSLTQSRRLILDTAGYSLIAVFDVDTYEIRCRPARLCHRRIRDLLMSQHLTLPTECESVRRFTVAIASLRPPTSLTLYHGHSRLALDYHSGVILHGDAFLFNSTRFSTSNSFCNIWIGLCYV